MGAPSLFWIVTTLVCVGSHISLIQGQPTYLAMVPRIMRPGRNLDVTIQALDTTNTINIDAKLVNNDVTLVSKTTSFENEVKISLQIPTSDLRDKYVLQLTGSGAATFYNETEIEVSFNSVMILIQTDKAIYKPGQTVKYRVMAIYPDMKAYLEAFTVQIFDKNGNKLEDIKDVKHETGVYSNEFVISQHPVMGDWKIKAITSTGESEEKIIAVEEFVLSSIEVKVELPSFFHDSMPKLVATVSAMYTYGKPVRGTAKVTINLSNDWYDYLPHPASERTVTLVNGKVDVMYSHADLNNLYKCQSSRCSGENQINRLKGHSLYISAVVTETLSGDKYVGDNNSVEVAYNLYEVKFLESTPDTFKDGLLFNGGIQVVRPDGTSPLPSDIHEKTLGISYYFTGKITGEGDRNEILEKTIEQSYPIPDSGIIFIQIETPSNMTSCQITAKFKYGKETATATKTIEKFVSEAGQGIQISIPDVNGAIEPSTTPVKFVITSTHAVSKYYYQLICKGKIINFGSLDASNVDPLEFSLTFDEALAQKCAPTARMLASCISPSGEVIVDSIEFSVNGAFANKVSVTFSASEAQPADSVTLTVNSSPNSYVGVLAIDQSVLLLKSGNDITQEQVLDKLGEFDVSPAFGGGPYPMIQDKRRKKRSFYCFWCWPRFSGGMDATEVFENAGVKVLTDAYIHGEEDDNDNRHVYYDMPVFANAGIIEESASIPAKEGGDELAEPERVRNLFPETWIWADNNAINSTGNDGVVEFSVTVPDTITSWVASAFAMNENQGLGIAEDTAKLVAFRQFFIQLDLPYSCIRGELLPLSVLVFNYLTTNLPVTVTLEESTNAEFYAANDKAELDEATSTQLLVQTTEVPAGDGVELLFWIKPVKLGQIKIQVKAQSKQAADAVMRTLLVEPEGEAQVYATTLFKDRDEIVSTTLNVKYPDNVVEGSQRVVLSLIGDIMGASINGIDSLLRIPGGCGEQNMLGFTPNIYALSYLTATQQATSDQTNKAKGNMKTGYQNELAFQRKDGSFSAFGNRDLSGSMWLTAFVVKSFEEAKRYITIEQNIINKSLRWILDNQKTGGSFKEPGKTLHTEMQGGASEGGPTLTAYVAITLIELYDTVDSTSLQQDVGTAIDDAMQYMSNILEEVKSDVYTMALLSYAFTLNGHADASKALGYFEELATVEGGMKYWKRIENDESFKVVFDQPYYQPSSNSIEMTAYATLNYLANDDMANAALTTRWLSKQRNSYGGFSSTQDTVIGLEALSSFSTAIFMTDNFNVDVTLSTDMDYNFDTITSSNFNTLQEIQINPSVNEVTVQMNGQGIALLQMSVFYNKKTSEDERGYSLIVYSIPNGDKKLKTKVCTSYHIKSRESGMVIVELGAFTGYSHITSNLIDQYSNLGLKKVEINNGKFLTLYLDQLTEDELCFNIDGVEQQPVDNLQSATASVYSYYRTDDNKKVLYDIGMSEVSSASMLSMQKHYHMIISYILIIILTSVLSTLMLV